MLPGVPLNTYIFALFTLRNKAYSHLQDMSQGQGLLLCQGHPTYALHITQLSYRLLNRVQVHELCCHALL